MKTTLHWRCLLLLGSLLVLCCCSRPEVALAVTQAPPQAAAKAPAFAAWQRELLELAFRSACKFPLEPHHKNRSRAQMVAVDACFRLGQPELALGFANDVRDWHRGSIYADYAFAVGQRGDADGARRHIVLAEQVAAGERENASGQEWRRDLIAMKVARAWSALGERDKAAAAVAGVEDTSLHAVDTDQAETAAERVRLLADDQAGKELAAIDAAFPTQSLGQQRMSVEVLVRLHERFFADQAIRTAVEQRFTERFDKLMPTLRLAAIARLARTDVANGDVARGKELVKVFRTIVENHRWRTEDRLPEIAVLVELTFLVGDADRARADAAAALADWHAQRESVVDIFRAEALRPLALAFFAIGDPQQGEAVLALAVEEGQENPNSRPRCDDLVDTAVALCLRGIAPSAKQVERMREISGALGEPW